MVLKKYFLFHLLFLNFIIPNNLSAQSTKKSSVELSGTITEISGKKISDVKITVYNNRDASIIDSLRTNAAGEFLFKFDLQQDYTLHFEKKGYIKKKILINTSSTIESNKTTTNYFDYAFQMSGLVSSNHTFQMPGLISSNYGGELIDKPIIKISFNPQKKIFDYDPIYAANLKQELAKLTPEQRDKLIAKLEAEAKSALIVATPVAATKPPPLEIVAPEKNIEPVVVLPDKIDKKEAASKIEINKENSIPIKKVIVKTEVKTAIKTLVVIPEIKAESNGVTKNEIAKIDIKRQEASYKKTIVEIIDRKTVIYEKFLQQIVLKKQETKRQNNLRGKYETGNPLTSFYDVTDMYELELKNKKIKK